MLTILVLFRKNEKIRKPSKTNFKFPPVIKSEIKDLWNTNIREATEEYKIPLKLAKLNIFHGSLTAKKIFVTCFMLSRSDYCPLVWFSSFIYIFNFFYLHFISYIKLRSNFEKCMLIHINQINTETNYNVNKTILNPYTTHKK